MCHSQDFIWGIDSAERRVGSVKQFLVLMSAFLLSGAALCQDSVSLPVGTTLKVRLENNLATLTSRTGDPFSARVAQAVELGGKTVVPVGATIEGRVTQVREPRRIEGKPTIGIFPETLIMPNGEHFVLNARLVDTSVGTGTSVNEEGQFKGKGYGGKDVAEIGVGTGTGMMIGILAGGGKGLLIGGVVGASATVGHWLSKKKYTSLPAGTELVMELSRPMEMHQAPAGQ
jgi:hypothetical protein